MKRASMLRLCLAASLIFAAAAFGDCQPGGRNLFTAGLEALSAGDLAAAARSFYRVSESQPDCAEAHNNLAVVFFEQGRVDEAEVQLHAALRANPDYQLARRNLERLAALRATRPQLAAAADGDPTPEVSGDAPAPTAPVEPTPHPTATARMPAPSPTAALSATPTIPTAGSTGLRTSAVCIIEPAENRLCVQERTAVSGSAVDESCYQIRSAAVHAWPKWVVAGAVMANRIRLLDETGQTRLEIVADDAAVTTDVLRLEQADFEALARKVVPWSTKWVVLE